MFQSELNSEDESIIKILTDKLKMSNKIDYMSSKIEFLERSITELKKSNNELKNILKALASSINPSLDFKELEQNPSNNSNNIPLKKLKKVTLKKIHDDVPF